MAPCVGIMLTGKTYIPRTEEEVKGSQAAQVQLWGPPGDLPNPGIEPGSFASPAVAGGFTTEPRGKPTNFHIWPLGFYTCGAY